MELTDVMAVSRGGEMIVGTPLVPDASIVAQVRSQDRDDKILVFKYKRKTRYRRKKGHRQPYTRLVISSIMLNGEEIAVAPAPEAWVPVEDEASAEEIVDAAVGPGGGDRGAGRGRDGGGLRRRGDGRGRRRRRGATHRGGRGDR